MSFRHNLLINIILIFSPEFVSFLIIQYVHICKCISAANVPHCKKIMANKANLASRFINLLVLAAQCNEDHIAGIAASKLCTVCL